MHKSLGRAGAIALLMIGALFVGGAAEAKTITTTTSWWGKTVTVYFNKAETANFATGASICAGALAAVPGLPATSIKAACGILAGMAGVAKLTGSCIGLATYYSRGSSVPNLGYKAMYHNQGYCR